MTGIVTLGGTLAPDVPWRSYRERGSGYIVRVTTPAVDPHLWQEYLAGALRSYRTHGVEHALDLETMQDGRTTSLLFVVLSADGKSIGGVRAQGPYHGVEQAHALVEWEGHPGQESVRTVLSPMVPHGMVEMKGAWVGADQTSRRELVACLARSPIHAARLLKARYAMGTAAGFAISGWAATGGVIEDRVPAVLYPDARYRTQLVWWDTWGLADSRSESERLALDEEDAQLRGADVPAQGR